MGGGLNLDCCDLQTGNENGGNSPWGTLAPRRPFPPLPLLPVLFLHPTRSGQNSSPPSATRFLRIALRLGVLEQPLLKLLSMLTDDAVRVYGICFEKKSKQEGTRIVDAFLFSSSSSAAVAQPHCMQPTCNPTLFPTAVWFSGEQRWRRFLLFRKVEFGKPSSTRKIC